MQNSAASKSPRDGMPSWYAVYTRHQHEKVVAQILNSKGFETFLPLYSAIRRWSDRTKSRLFPFFPCYVFLNAHLSRQFDVVTTPGVHNLVSVAGRPAVIAADEIAAMRRVEATGRLEPHPFLRSGDWVRVRSGALEGIEGMLSRKKNSLRLVLSVELLEKSVAVEVDSSAVERVTRSGARAKPTLQYGHAIA